MNTNTPQQSYTIKSTAELLACLIATIYRMINKGSLKTFYVGADQRITADEINKVQSGKEA